MTFSMFEKLCSSHVLGSAAVSSTLVEVRLSGIVDMFLPVFTPSQYIASVDINAAPGVSVLAVQAVDRDIGVAGQLTYHIASGNFGSVFDISPTTGFCPSTLLW